MVQNPQPQVSQPHRRRCGTCGWPGPATPTPRPTRPTARLDRVRAADQRRRRGHPEGRAVQPRRRTRRRRRPASFDYFRLSTQGAGRHDRAGDHGRGVRHRPTDGWYTGPATVTLTAADEAGGSGVASTEYQLDGATDWTAYTAPVPVTGDGAHEVRFRSTDEAGNVEATKTVAVKIDATAPVTSATFAPANDDGWHDGAVPVVLTVDRRRFRRRRSWSGRWTAAPGRRTPRRST